jgi:hypothetical protein
MSQHKAMEGGSLKRHAELLKATKEYLDLKNVFYVSRWQTRCHKCGNIQSTSPSGCDILVVSHEIEIKTGNSKLTEAQKKERDRARRYGVPYTVVENTIDQLVNEI